MKNILKITTILLIVAGGFSCGKDDKTIIEEHGVIPSSIEQVIDVFELKYGEVKEWVYNNRVFKFSITDLEDNLMTPPMTGYIPNFCEICRMHLLLNVETDRRIILLKISSGQCGLSYEGLSTAQNIQYIRNILELSQSNHSTDFQQNFSFGDGALIENPSLSIFLALSYSNLNHGQKDNKNLYKFIFIITNKN